MKLISLLQIIVKKHLYWVFADLCAEKNTIKILRDLNKGYPFASNEMEEREQKALGEENLKIINLAIKYMAEGDAESLGKLMTGAQILQWPLCARRNCLPPNCMRS